MNDKYYDAADCYLTTTKMPEYVRKMIYLGYGAAESEELWLAMDAYEDIREETKYNEDPPLNDKSD